MERRKKQQSSVQKATSAMGCHMQKWGRVNQLPSLLCHLWIRSEVLILLLNVHRNLLQFICTGRLLVVGGGVVSIPRFASFTRFRTLQKVDHHRNNRWASQVVGNSQVLRNLCTPQPDVSTAVGNTVTKTVSLETAVENNTAARQPILLREPSSTSLSVHAVSWLS